MTIQTGDIVSFNRTASEHGPAMLSVRLRAARQSACLTQGAVGVKLDPPHTRKNVCKWEHGQTEPSLRTVEQLAAVLNVSPCWLAFGDTHRAQ